MEAYHEIYNSKVKGLSSDEDVYAWKPYVENELDERSNAGLAKSRYEVEKSETDSRTIGLAIDIVRRDMQEMGFSDFDIPLDRIHLIPLDRMAVPGSTGEATMEAIRIPVASNEAERLDQFKALVHELWHHASITHYDAREFIATADKYLREMNLQGYSTTNLRRVKPSRSGYYSFKEERSPQSRPLNGFHGLNEAVTERCAIDSFEKHRDEIMQEFNISDENYNNVLSFLNNTSESSMSSYPQQRKVLDLIINGVSKHFGEDRSTTWERLKKGFISGKMMHLKRIERTFGNGSLGLLSLMYGEDANFILPKYVELFQYPPVEGRDVAIREIIDYKSGMSGIRRTLRRLRFV